MNTNGISAHALAYGAFRWAERINGQSLGTPPDSGRGAFPDRSPAYTVELSPRALELSSTMPGAAARETPGSLSPTGESSGAGPVECETCANRKYRDVSNDSTVSFQTPTKLAPAEAEVLVRAHEQEHVSHEQVSAKERDEKVVSQNVVIHYGICPECGRPFVSGGTTTTVTSAREPFETSQPEPGKSISLKA